MKLDPSFIDNSSCDSVQRIDLADDGPLANAAETWIARTCAQVVDLGGNQGGSGACSRSCGTGFGSCMSTADNYNIEGSGCVVSNWGVPCDERARVAYLLPLDTVARRLTERKTLTGRPYDSFVRKMARMAGCYVVIDREKKSCAESWRMLKLSHQTHVCAMPLSGTSGCMLIRLRVMRLACNTFDIK